MTAALESKVLANEMTGYLSGLPEEVQPRIHLSLHCETERDFFITINSLGGPAKFKTYESHLALLNEPSPLLVSVFPPSPYGQRPRWEHPLINKVQEMQENIKHVEASLSDA